MISKIVLTVEGHNAKDVETDLGTSVCCNPKYINLVYLPYFLHRKCMRKLEIIMEKK